MISNIQALRAFAAAAVVFYHTDFHFNGDTHTEFQGVAIFFVISGFIMTYITRSKSDGFIWDRITRIVPLYWVMTVALVVIGWSVSALALTVRNLTGTDEVHYCVLCHVPAWFDSSNLTMLAKSLFFVPYAGPSAIVQPLLAVGWTLNLEMFFYIVFAISLAISVIYAPFLVCGVLLGIKLAAYLFWPAGAAPLLVEFYAQPYTTYFILGIACYYAWQQFSRLKLSPRGELAAAGTISIILLCFFVFETGFIFKSDTSPMVNSGLLLALPPLVVLSALVGHSIGLTVTSSLVIALGNASYALYLLHTIVIEFLRLFWRRYPAFDPKFSVIAMAVILIGCIGISLIVYRFVEVPMIAAIRNSRRLSPARRRRSADGSAVGG